MPTRSLDEVLDRCPLFLESSDPTAAATIAVLAVAVVALLGARTARAQLTGASTATTGGVDNPSAPVSPVGFTVTFRVDAQSGPDGGWPLDWTLRQTPTWINRYDSSNSWLSRSTLQEPAPRRRLGRARRRRLHGV